MKTEGAIVKEDVPQSSFWWRQKEDAACTAHPPKAGDVCAACDRGILVYDGLFVLACTHCGKTAESGAFT